MSYTNQKTVQVKKMKCDKQHLYTRINLEAIQCAMNELKKVGAFKLWLYFAKNQDQYRFDLSCEDCKRWGVKADSFHTGINELIKKGYLQKVSGNFYIFHEMPPSTEIP